MLNAMIRIVHWADEFDIPMFHDVNDQI
jgi:hypothetical protein